ncbi:MAG TPA: hypothetical protein VN961_07320 [Streptosporangiaceae bacterium]|nr:hypothetical protein [Streptosporangiaceae bacterium]
MSDNLASAGQRVFELFGACAANPDDVTIGAAADHALRQLDQLIAGADQDR